MFDNGRRLYINTELSDYNSLFVVKRSNKYTLRVLDFFLNIDSYCDWPFYRKWRYIDHAFFYFNNDVHYKYLHYNYYFFSVAHLIDNFYVASYDSNMKMVMHF